MTECAEKALYNKLFRQEFLLIVQYDHANNSSYGAEEKEKKIRDRKERLGEDKNKGRA